VRPVVTVVWEGTALDLTCPNAHTLSSSTTQLLSNTQLTASSLAYLNHCILVVEEWLFVVELPRAVSAYRAERRVVFPRTIRLVSPIPLRCDRPTLAAHHSPLTHCVAVNVDVR